MTRCRLFIACDLIEINTGVSPGKMFFDRCKNHGCRQINQSALAPLYLASRPLPNVANSSDVSTEFAGGDQLSVPYAIPMMSALRIDWFRFLFCSWFTTFRFTKCFCFAAEHNKDEVLEGKFCNLNFSPSTKKTTEYSFELFLSIYRYKYCRTIVLLNKLKLIKETFFQTRRWSCDFPPRETLVAEKHRAISRQGKMTVTCRSYGVRKYDKNANPWYE